MAFRKGFELVVVLALAVVAANRAHHLQAVPSEAENASLVENRSSPSPAASTHGSPAASQTRGESLNAARLRDGEPLEINDASAVDFSLLPGVGPALSMRIITWRQTHGPFASVASLLAVRGVGPATLARIQPWIACSSCGLAPIASER